MKLNRIKISNEIFFTLNVWEKGGKLYGCDRHEESHIGLVARWDKGVAKIYYNDFMNGSLYCVIEFLKERVQEYCKKNPSYWACGMTEDGVIMNGYEIMTKSELRIDGYDPNFFEWDVVDIHEHIRNN